MSGIEDEEVEARPSYPFSAWGMAYEVVTFCAVIAHSASTFLTRVAADFASHNNNVIDARREKQARRLLIDDLKSLERGDLP